jgi:hypothetical protein
MTERPIIFSAPMVRAILAGTKTQDRRVVKPQPQWVNENAGSWIAIGEGGMAGPRSDWLHWRGERIVPNDPRCPYGQPGDRLWVREAWQAFFDDEVQADRPRGPRHTMGQPARPDRKSFVFYKADGPGPVHPDGFQALWNSPLHLPRKYSRITLEVTAIRVERLRDISEADAIAEGVIEHQTLCPGTRACNVDGGPMMACGPITAYRALWESINGPNSWEANPWVWAIEFKRVNKAEPA